MTSWTNLRRSSGETFTSSRWRILSSAALTSLVSASPDRPRMRGATSVSTSSRTLRFDASHEAALRDLARVRPSPVRVFAAPVAFADFRSSSSSAASFSESFMVSLLPLVRGGFEALEEPPEAAAGSGDGLLGVLPLRLRQQLHHP